MQHTWLRQIISSQAPDAPTQRGPRNTPRHDKHNNTDRAALVQAHDAPPQHKTRPGAGLEPVTGNGPGRAGCDPALAGLGAHTLSPAAGQNGRAE